MSASFWTKLKEPPSKIISQLLSINSSDFVIIPERRTNETITGADGIYRYDMMNNEWLKIMKYSKDFVSTQHMATIDKKTKLIYVCNAEKELLEIDLKTKTVIKLTRNTDFGTYPSIFCVNHIIHIFNEDNNKYFMFNQKTKRLKELQYLLKYQIDSNVFHWYSQNRIISTSETSIVEFSIPLNRWNEWKIETRKNLFFSQIFATKNDEYLIFIGGSMMGMDEWSDCISIYNVKTEKFVSIGIRAPIQSAFIGTIWRNDDRDELLTFGFINTSFKASQFINIHYFPFYLIKLISNWVCYETLHLIAVPDPDHDIDESSKFGHWMIDVDKIIQST